MSVSSALLFISLGGDGMLSSQHREWMDAFRAHGFAPVHCATTQSLHEAAGKVEHKPGLVLLDGPLAQLCAAVRYLRVRHPALSSVALLPVLTQQSMLAAFRSGADNCAPADASIDLVVMILLSLLRRMPLPEPELSSIPQGQPWTLCDQAWVLRGPTGKVVPLTTSERAFMLALMRSPDFRASHADLAAAIEADNRSGATAQPQARLGVLVSRMRRKVASSQELALPLKSLHSWGYMFTGTMLRRDP